MNKVFKNFLGEKYVLMSDTLNLYRYDEKEFQTIDENPQNPIDGHRTGYLSNLAIILNNSCNLACKYCYANKGHFDKADEKVSIFRVKRVVLKMIEQVRTHGDRKMSITFFGGEPLLSFEQIRDIVVFTEKEGLGINIRYLIVTNGTLLNDDIVAFFKHYHFIVTLSFDGDKETHDSYRPFWDGNGSFDVLSQNVMKYGKEINPICRITAHNGNTDMLKSVMVALNIGFKKIAIGFDASMDDNAFEKFIYSYKKLLDFFYQEVMEGRFFVLDNVHRIINALLFKRRISSRCNAGRAYFTLSADGLLYGCHRMVGIREQKVCSAEDNIEEAINLSIQNTEKAINQRNRSENIPCGECPYLYLCGGSCFHSSFSSCGKTFMWSSKDCRLSKIAIAFTLKFVTSVNKAILLEYIGFINGYTLTEKDE